MCFFLRDDEKASVSKKVLAEVAKWMERFDCLVVGPGLGRDPFLLVSFLQFMNIHYAFFLLGYAPFPK